MNYIFIQTLWASIQVPWIDNAPDFSSFTEPTLSILVNTWQEFLASNGSPEVFSDEQEMPAIPNWDAFNAFMLSDVMFKSYRDAVRAVDGDLNAALFNAYAVVATRGVGAFVNVWAAWSQVADISSEDKSTIASAATSFNLPEFFVDALAA